MNNVEQAKSTRNGGLGSFLTDNSSVYSTDPAFKAAAKKFHTDNDTLVASAAGVGLDNAGFSQDKLDAKTDMGESASTLSAAAQVKLDALGKHSVSMALHDAETYYTDPADAVAAARAQAAHDLLKDNLADLTPDYVQQTDLDDLQKLIDTFLSTQGSSQAAHSITPAATAAFKSNIKVVDKDVKDLLKLGKKYKKTNLTFYNSLVAACELPAINIHHTNADLTLHDAVTGDPVKGAIGGISNSKTTATSDDKGFLLIEHVGAGNHTLTITAAGYKTFTMLVHIASGKENPFTILLEKA